MASDGWIEQGVRKALPRDFSAFFTRVKKDDDDVRLCGAAPAVVGDGAVLVVVGVVGVVGRL